jgi:hypothetical protein
MIKDLVKSCCLDLCFEGDEFLLIAEHASRPAIASAAANAREIASHERTIAEAQKRLGEAAQNISAIQKFFEARR